VACGRLCLNNSAGSGYVGAEGPSGTVYYQPYNGNTITTWNTTLLQYENISFGILSLSLSPCVANTNYDIFLANNNGVASLALGPAWATSTGRSASVPLAFVDGMWFYGAAGNKYMRYIGTIRTTATAGQTTDSQPQRFVWNLYNQGPRRFYNYTTVTGTYTFSNASSGTTANRPICNSTFAVEWVIGLGIASQQYVWLRGCGEGYISAGSGNWFLNLLLDGSSGLNNAQSFHNQGFPMTLRAFFEGNPGVGYHWCTLQENLGNTGSVGTTATVTGWAQGYVDIEGTIWS
jgi:hypothetical protein